MSKINLSDVTSGSSTTINRNFQKIEDALNDEVLYRDNPSGTPNQMEDSLDMNSHDILNAGVIRAKVIVADSLQSEGDSIIEGGVKNNEIVKWDAEISKFVPTGVYSLSEGEISTATNSVNIGAHDIGSAGRNVVITNRVEGRHWSSIDQEIGLSDVNTTNAFQRERGQLETFVFGSDSNEVLTDPSWEFSTENNETVLTIQLWPEIDMTDVEYIIYENGTPIYRDNLGTFIAGDNQSIKILHTPYDLYASSTYTASLRTLDGSPCRFRGGR